MFKLVDWYTMAATDGALGMLGEHLVLAAQKFLLIAEEANSYGEKRRRCSTIKRKICELAGEFTETIP